MGDVIGFMILLGWWLLWWFIWLFGVFVNGFIWGVNIFGIGVILYLFINELFFWFIYVRIKLLNNCNKIKENKGKNIEIILIYVFWWYGVFIFKVVRVSFGFIIKFKF